MKKEDLILQIYTKAKSRCNHFVEYYHITPTPITMDDGKIINVEWVQPSYWGCDVLINYRTDNLKTTKLSEKELEQILEII